jgi:hypothetical protein
MQPGLAGLIVWAGIELVLVVAFAVTQQIFYEESRKTHGLWRPPSERWVGPTWQELSAMGSATFRKHDDRVAEKARLRYLRIFALAVGWGFLGLPIAFVMEGIARRLLNLVI